MTVNEIIAVLGFVLTVLVLGFGAVIWFVRLEGRVNTTIALQEQFKEWVEKEHAGLAVRFDDGLRDVKASIDKVFDRLDKKADK
jgi:hypothetical protein